MRLRAMRIAPRRFQADFSPRPMRADSCELGEGTPYAVETIKSIGSVPQGHSDGLGCGSAGVQLLGAQSKS
jgi:hypothetical protein